MKKLLSLVMTLVLLLPIVFAATPGTGAGVGIDMTTEMFEPLVWLGSERFVYHNNADGGVELVERVENYAFEGESVCWPVLVMDKNGVEKIADVYVAVGDSQSGGSGTTTITRTGTVSNCDSIPLTNTDWNYNLVLNKFDSSLGTLISAEIELNTAMFSIISIQNQDVGPITVTLNADGAVNIDPIDGPIVTTQITISEDFVANQGMNNFEVDDSDSESYTASNLGEYIAGVGDTTFNLPADASATAQLSGSGNFIGGVSTQASAEACVIYTYQYEVTVPGGNDIEANCDLAEEEYPLDIFNPWILEEQILDFDPNTMALYNCCLFVETPESMYGEYWVVVGAIDLDGQYGSADENSYWFFNPVIALTVDGDINFGEVRPGTLAYSDTLLVGNDADPGSGVLLDMYISGTDFYDPSSSGAKCPVSNILALTNFAYYATNGGHETVPTSARAIDVEGYYNIPYETGDPTDRLPIIQDDGVITLGGIAYWAGNVLTPGAEIAVTFRLALPEPCNGDFSSGSIFFWGEAI